MSRGNGRPSGRQPHPGPFRTPVLFVACLLLLFALCHLHLPGASCDRVMSGHSSWHTRHTVHIQGHHLTPSPPNRLFPHALVIAVHRPGHPTGIPMLPAPPVWWRENRLWQVLQVGTPDARGQQRLSSPGQQAGCRGACGPIMCARADPGSPPGGGGRGSRPADWGWEALWSLLGWNTGEQNRSSRQRRGSGWDRAMGEGSSGEGRPGSSKCFGCDPRVTAPEGESSRTRRPGQDRLSQERTPEEHRQPRPLSRYGDTLASQPPVCHQGLL